MDMAPKTILLVEDEAIIALSEARQLESAGYSVIHAPTGEQAIAIVRDAPGKVDLTLMDLDLGEGIDGTVAAREILHNHEIPVVFLSSHMEPEIVKKTESITNYGYVVKSSTFTVLDASIKMAFRLFEEKKRSRRRAWRWRRPTRSFASAWKNCKWRTKSSPYRTRHSPDSSISAPTAWSSAGKRMA